MSDETLARPLTNRFSEALSLACELHHTQARKGTQIPYVSHLLGVASLSLEHGATEDEAIAAVLHDAVEDQGGASTAQRIRAMFGDAVADIVLACTDADVVPKPPWRERKEMYIKHIHTASPSALLVSACDKLHNARAIVSDYRALGEALWDRFTGGRDGTLWYYRSLVDAFTVRGATRVVGELDRVVSELEALSMSSAAAPDLMAEGVPGATASPPQAERQTILLAENNPRLLQHFSRTLAKAGYHVLPAGDGGAAVAIARERLGAVDLFIADLHMKPVGGRAAADALVAVHGDVPVLFVSGCADDGLARIDMTGRRRHFLKKPFSPCELLAKIDAILAADDAPR